MSNNFVLARHHTSCSINGNAYTSIRDKLNNKQIDVILSAIDFHKDCFNGMTIIIDCKLEQTVDCPNCFRVVDVSKPHNDRCPYCGGHL